MGPLARPSGVGALATSWFHSGCGERAGSPLVCAPCVSCSAMLPLIDDASCSVGPATAGWAPAWEWRAAHVSPSDVISLQVAYETGNESLGGGRLPAAPWRVRRGPRPGRSPHAAVDHVGTGRGL